LECGGVVVDAAPAGLGNGDDDDFAAYTCVLLS